MIKKLVNYGLATKRFEYENMLEAKDEFLAM